MGVAVFCLFGLAASAWADTVTVTSTGDSGPGSLRAAVAGADGGDTIAFDASLDGETIKLTSGAIGIAKSLTIAGPGASELTVDADHDSRIFTVTAGNLSVSGLTLADGAAPPPGEVIFATGGAISYTGTGSLTVSDCVFSGNTAGGPGTADDNSGQGWGGGIYMSPSAGSLSVSESVFTANATGGAGGSGDHGGRSRGGAIDYSGSGSLTVSDSTFDGNAAGGTGGTGFESGLGRGGAISVSEHALSISVSASTFTANTSGGSGGGGSFSGRGEGGAIKSVDGVPLTVSASTFSANTAGGADGPGSGDGFGSGGAINSFGELTVSQSTFTANTAGARNGDSGNQGFGGAINNFDNVRPLTVSASTFTANAAGGVAGRGGAIYVSSVSPRSALASNSTLVGNAAGASGGAIDVNGAVSATVVSATIDANAVDGGGVGAGIGGASAVTARATIVSGNTGATNCDAPVASSSYSLEGPSATDTSCGFALPSADPLLEPLAGNGGPTETQALPSSSPAVGVVPAAACPTSVDQRGEPRPDYGKPFCDIGAFELQGPIIAAAITSAATTTFQIGQAASFTVTTTGVPAPSLSHTGTLPSGVGFTDSGNGTATLAGTPAAGTEGVYPITIEAANEVLPDAAQSFTLTVQAPPTIPDTPPGDDAPKPNPKPPTPPKSPLTLKLSPNVERNALRKLRRTGNLAVTATVNDAAKLVLTGRAKLAVHAHGKTRTTLVAILEGRMVRFARAGKKKIELALSEKGREALRGLRKVRLTIAGIATDTSGRTARKTLTLTLLQQQQQPRVR